MAMVVKNNMAAVSTLNTLNRNSGALQKSLAKVSSGMKINSAQDDASGYAISERMRVQIRALDQANQNTQNGSSMMKTAEGAVSSTIDILKTLKEKAINAATDTNTDDDRKTIQKEVNQFIDQIDDNALVTFNGKYLVEGSKVQAGGATVTAMTNQKLGLYETDGTTDLTGGSKLTDLTNRKGEDLNIADTDYVTASFIKDGKTYSVNYKVANTTLDDIFTKLTEEYQTKIRDTTAEVFGAATADFNSTTAVTKALGAIAATDKAELEEFINGTKTAADLDSTNALHQALVILGNNTTTELDDNIDTASSTLVSKVATALDAASATATLSSTNCSGTDSGASDVSGKSGTATIADTTAVTGYVSNAFVVTLDSADVAVKFGSASDSGTKTLDAANDAAEEIVTKALADAQAKVGDADNLVADAVGDAIDDITQTITFSASLSNVGSADPKITSGDFKSLAIDLSADTSVSAATDDLELAVLIKAAAAKVASLDSTGDLEAAAEEEYSKSSGFLTSSVNIGKNAAGDTVTTADGTPGLTVKAANAGLEGQVSGLTISISNSEGQVRKTINEYMNGFSTTIFASNESEDLSLKLQVGANANQSISVGLSDMRSEALGLKGADGTIIDLTTQERANAAIAAFDNAIAKALDQQTTIGAVEARLEYTASNLTTSAENTQAAESSIRDADMAKEMTNYTKNNVLLQAAQSMLAQANQNSSAVLSLLQ